LTQKTKNINIESEINNEGENLTQNKEINSTQEENSLKNEEKKSTKTTTNNTNVSKHGKCVPLAVYQKVFDDKQRLISQLDIINTQLQTALNNEKINLVSSLQIQLEKAEKEKNTLENIIIKQEKSITNLKTKLAKYEKQLNKKGEEILIKDTMINDLKTKIEELIEKNKAIKNNFKLSEKNEIIKMNDIINSLKNEMEIKEKKFELNNKKFTNLQIKYLKLIQQKRKMENESLLKLSKEQMTNMRLKNNLSTPKKLNLIPSHNTIKNNRINNNKIIPTLPLIDVSSTINKQKINLEVKESFSMTNTDE